MPYEKLFPEDEVYIMYDSKTGEISGPFNVAFNGELLRLRWSPINPQEQTTRNDRAELATMVDQDTKVLEIPTGKIVLMEYLDPKVHSDYKEDAKLILKNLTSSIYRNMTRERIPQKDKTYMLYKGEPGTLSGPFRVIFRSDLLRFVWAPVNPKEQVTKNDFVMRAVPDVLSERVFHTNAGTIALIEYSKGRSDDDYRENGRLILER